MKILPALILLALIAACGAKHPYVTLRGTVRDSASGTPVAGARVSEKEFTRNSVRTDDSGRFEMRGVAIVPHDIFLDAERYRAKTIRFFADGKDSALRFDADLRRVPDTAYTIFGPVDASFLMSDTLLKRKKLSQNEAKRIALRQFAGGKILGSDLIEENRQLLWIFDIQHGKDQITILIDAYTGKVASVEGLDPQKERREQRRRGDARDQ